MNGFNDGEDEDVISSINITPFVDIILVVLIIFMVTTSYIVQAQIEVNLPKAASGQSEVTSTLTFQVTKDGDYLLDGEMLTLEQIVEAVKRSRVVEPDVRAIIAADKDVEYGKVIDLIDVIKLNGIEKFALNIVRKEKIVQ